MKPTTTHGRVAAKRGSAALGMCLLFLLAPVLSMVEPASFSSPQVKQSVFYTPGANATGVNLTSTGVLSIPANETFLDGTLEITPTWTDAGLTGNRFGIDLNAGWSGTHNGTQGIGHGGQLSLATSSTLATLTDFETLVETLPDWEGQGPNHGAWNVQLMTGTSVSSGQPANATDGQRVLATQGLGGLDANMSGCLASPSMPVPAFVSRYNLSFDHWLSMNDDDAAWVEWRVTGSSWQTLTPLGSYPNASALPNAPSSVWSGQSSAWERATFQFDSLLPASATSLDVRLCFATSDVQGTRNGWFIDNLSITNQGDQPGAWFHGNFSGDYANNANGRLYILSDLSGYSGPLQLEFWANWDLEGAFSDNLLVSLSVNNGSTWQTVSGIPGLPGNGYTSQGTFYMDESLGWVPITYSLPTGLSSHANASSVLFEFHVQTNHQTGFGGFASSGWEGVAIDDIVVHHRRGTSLAEEIQLANFTNTSSDVYGDESGWLDHSSSINEWVWTTMFGMNGPTSSTNSFEQSMIAPPGWVIEGTWPDGWEIGATRNTSGYGPGVFHSGDNGAAINLTTKYTNNVYTHLVTQEYALPTNASARLAFQSWVCTEANWDGGGVSISTDGGQTWWWLPTDLNGFHDQVSTANTNSPFFGRGIIDGSTQPNGCNSNKNRPFELKTYDLSNLSGQNVKARFSFFSDTFVEADGWYIDDAGIEIDVFEVEGSWTSPALSPDPLYGYGWLDAWYEQPLGTTLSVDVLDINLNPISGHQNLSFPAALAIDPVEHPSVHLRVSMTTNDTYVTPMIHSMVLGRTAFLSPQHVLQHPDGQNASTINGEGELVVQDPFSLNLPAFAACPFDGYRLTTVGDNLTWQLPSQQLISLSYVSYPKATTYSNYSLGGELSVYPSFTLAASGGEVVERAKVELDCVRPTDGPSLALGWNNASVFDWPPSGMADTLGLNTRWSETTHAGTTEAWNPTDASPSFQLSDASVVFGYLTVERTVNPSFSQEAALTISVTNRTENTTVHLNGGSLSFANNASVLTTNTNGGCPSASVVSAYSSEFSLYRCQISLAVNGSADVKVVNFMHLAGSKTLVLNIDSSTMNSAKAASDVGDVRAVLDIPLHINTERGGVRVGLTANTLPLMTEAVDTPAFSRWLPETTVSFTTIHHRENPLNQLEDAPDITSVDLYLSSTPSVETSFAHIQVDQLQTSPRFRQLGGAGLAQLNPSLSSTSCDLNSCSVTWSLTSTWLLDDVDDLHVLTQATDDEGLHVGPFVFVRKTPFNEVENDMEVVDFSVVDEASRRLDDWTNSFWPYHLGANESMLAQGRVRLEGIANEWVADQHAEASVTVQAVPPKNLSGGPDEWPSDPVVWSRTWSADVGQDGWFSIPLSSPSLEEEVPSNTWLEIIPSLSRRGPIDVNATTSEDRTVVLAPTRILHDTISPSVESLNILDSGREVPADGHVMMVGKNLPFRLELSDPEGLNSLLEVWTWLEKQDDDNGDGVMDEDEYTVQTLSLNRGSTFIEVDLPLLASFDALPLNAFEGKVSVFVRGYDLAGNPLLGGGDVGEANDLATVIVQQRADTIGDVEDVSLNTVNGRLLAGHAHQFNVTIADANSLASLDELQLFLLGEDRSSSCFVTYEPRFGQVAYDTDCFIEAPIVTATARPLTTIYDVVIQFRLGWNASQSFALSGGIPSFKVIDEGQDLGLGLHRLSASAWTPSTELDMRWIDIIDTMEPTGEANQTTRWFHRNDVVHHHIGIYHAGTTHLARDIPHNGSFAWELNDGERRMNGAFNISASGSMFLNISMNENVMYHDYGNMSVVPVGYEDFGLNGLSYLVVLDDRAPKLVLAPGTLEHLASNELEQVNITISINDDTHMPPGPLRMHSVFYRMGQPVEETRRVDELDITAVVNAYTVYDGVVNFLPEGTELTRSDILVVWFEATDRSGRALTGLGSSTAPLNVGMTWVAFEPVFTDLSATPYRPQLGDNVVVYVRVANDGLLPGEMNVVLWDDEGLQLANQTVQLNTSEWVNVVWEVEAWKEGRLGLSVEIENHTPLVPIPLADIQPRDSDNANSSMAAFSLSVLALVIAAVVLFMVNQRRAEREEAYHLERIRRIVNQRLPPPFPLELVETSQEE